jgi:tRNA A37 threonylcarbamoyladenosine modification protein TsaB
VALATGRVLAGGEFLVATDARRREVYWARYRLDDGWPVRLSGPAVSRPADLDRDGLPVAGRGALLYPEALGTGLDGVPPDPTAADLARLAVRGEPYLVEPRPMYLRRPDAVPGTPKRVR